ncbi:MAS20-domain-containing protein [Auriculariales sp. MPI-PUGE-AT-0066]|nr:MAS20-domain-containing protein [Auriculariales sp. MPI-PUGE-AT-0066]
MNMPSTTTTTVITVATVTVLGGALAYALYFDHKRRNDLEFRKQLRKEQKRVKKAREDIKATSTAAASGSLTDEDMQAALDAIRSEPLPTTTQEREAYFSEHIADGELLSQRGPASYLQAALAFYRGLRVYPAPLELIMIYQKTVPEPIFNILMKLTTFEVKRRAEAYYSLFPPKSMNVEVKQVPVDDNSKMLKNVLVAAKDFAVGDVIYKEFPMASALDMDLEGRNTHCSQCMQLLTGVPVILENDPLGSAYCSQNCRTIAQDQHHSLLFSLEPLLGLDDDSAPPAGPRRQAQQAMAQHLKQTDSSRTLMAMRLFAHQALSDTRKVIAVPGGSGNEDQDPSPPEAEDNPSGKSEYTFADHLERLRFLELKADKTELTLVRGVLATALGTGDEILPDEQYEKFKGKVAYSAVGVVYNGGRERAKNPGKKELEDFEWTRTPLGTQRQVGSAFYRVSSYVTHSCTPSVRPTFPKGNYQLHLVASRSITKGEELTMAFVEVARQASETAAECCLRRRKQLVKGWSFVCMCPRCFEERQQPAAVGSPAPAVVDDSHPPSSHEGSDTDEPVMIASAEFKDDDVLSAFEEEVNASPAI